MSIKNILKILILCIVLASTSSIGIAIVAPPNLPGGLYGDVKIGASPAPKDTKIEGKVGDTTVATTYVVNSGKYGDDGNYLGISAPNEGDNVDVYVNGVFVTTVKYTGEEPARLDLNSPGKSTSAGTTVSSEGGKADSGGNKAGSGESKADTGGSKGGSGGEIKSTTTAPQSAAVTPINSAQGGTGTKENTVDTTAAPSTDKPAVNFYMILGVFTAMAAIGIILKKSGKI